MEWRRLRSTWAVTPIKKKRRYEPYGVIYKLTTCSIFMNKKWKGDRAALRESIVRPVGEHR